MAKRATSAAVEPTNKRAGRRAGPRRPLQERGRARYEALLDCVEAMVVERDPTEIGFYEIAEKAGMAAASVYHFFPTKNAMFLALAERYFDHFRRGASVELDAARPSTWQDYFRQRHERAVAYYNANVPAMRLILGAQPFLDIRSVDNLVNKELSRRSYERLGCFFHLPYIVEPERKFLIGLSLADATWRISFTEHGRITPDYSAEATRAVLAYMRTFLPEDLEPRE